MRQEELVRTSEVERDLKELKKENEALKEKDISLLAKCENLYYTELQKAVVQERETQEKFLTDKFCISGSAYHELTMTTGGENLPRSYLIKQCKENLNQLCHITRTPGTADGAQLSFQEELTNRIKSQLEISALMERKFLQTYI